MNATCRAFLVPFAILLATQARAGTLDETKVALTLKAHATKAQCTTNAPTWLACDSPAGTSNLVVDGQVGVGYDMYLVCLDIEPTVGLGGVALGIAYPPELVIYSWSRCSDLEFLGQGWPASGGGNSITFNTVVNCPGQVPDPTDPQGEGSAILGWFYCYAYAPALFEITRRNIANPDFKVADCSASESSPPFPDAAGKVGFGRSGYQPCRAPDDTPPSILSAVGTAGSNHVIVTFSEQVGSGAATLANYILRPGPGGQANFPLVGAMSAGAQVDLELSEPLDYGTTYTVTVNNVRDMSDNAIAPNSTASFTTADPPPLDVTPPTLIAASGAAGSRVIRVDFSEALGSGAAHPANYEVTPGPGGQGSSTVLLAGLSGSLVALTLADTLEYATTYTVTVSDVADLAGNAIAPGSFVTFTTPPDPAVDTTPPHLRGVSGAAGHELILVVFSESVGAGAADVANYTVTPGPGGVGSFVVIGALLNDARVTLTLSGLLEYATEYTVTVSNVADLAGNVIAPNSQLSFPTPPSADTTPPVLLAATGAAGNSTIVLTFSEGVGAGAVSVGNYHVAPGPDGAAETSVSAVAAAGTGVMLTLGSTLDYGTTYTVTVSNVADLSGNVIEPNSSRSFTTAPAPVDSTPPVLTAATGSAGSALITVQFSESVGYGATSVANFTVTPGPGGVEAFAVQSATLNGSRVELTLGGPLEFATTYTVTVSNVADLAGNVIAPGSAASFTTADPPPPDTTGPTLISASGVAGKYKVFVRFSELVASGANVAANYRITDEPPTHTAVSVFSASVSGDQVTLVLGGALSPPGTYRLTVNNVQDLEGNVIAPGSYVTFAAASPQLQHPLIALHVKSHATKVQCTANAPTGLCRDYVVDASVGVSYDLYMVVVDLSYAAGGIAGVACGISYPKELAVYSWARCSDLEFPGQGWPASGGGNTITWDRIANCQVASYLGEVHAVAGWFYVYAYGASTFSIVPRNVPVPDLKVADCNALEYDLQPFDDVAKVAFGTRGAWNPCWANPPANVETTTWGAIKRTYGIKE